MLPSKGCSGPARGRGANPPDVVPCLRVETIGKYDPDEDEFEARTFFSHSPDAPDQGN
jgi:putative ATP-dependent endonuclease of OLD family